MDGIEAAGAGAVERLARRPWAAFSGVYAAYGATFGVLGGGAPLVLRAHGVALAHVGLLQLIYLPIGLAFLWAPLIDRFKIPGLPHRIGWIATGMAATSALLMLLGATTTWPVPFIFVVGLCVSVAMTTADIALEALVVETVDSAHRSFVTTAKLVGSAVGTMIGVGLATAFPDRIGLPGALFLVAVLDVVFLAPLGAYTEPSRARTRERRRREPARARLLLRHAAIMGFFFAPAILIVSVPNLVLLDLKLSLPVVGFFTGALTSAINIVGTLAAGFAMTRIPAHRLVAGLATGVTASAVLLALAVATASPWFGFMAAFINVVFESGLGVPVFNVLYKWAQGEHAATDYAFLLGVAFLVSFPARVVGPMLAAAIGWPAYFLACAPVYAIAVLLLVRAMRPSET